ncbi:MAG: agmatinase [Candidatus Gastranaerophilales bacterium]|nr:agmatinase [Candidatus Gastranaerophilales bacterium]
MLKGPFLSKDFIGANPSYEESKIVMLGMPYDCTCSNRAGTRFGPQAARLESIGIETYSVYFDSEMDDLNFYDAGDLEYPFGNAKRALDITEENVDCIYNDNKKLLGVGGEHLITLASVKSVLKKYDNVAVVQFDAHTDLRKQYLGEELTHSGVMYQIAQLIGFENIAQIGLRSGEKEEFDLVKKYDTLKTKKEQLDKFKDKNIFLTIDLDVLDPSLMSGVGTPEAGGLTYLELMEWIMYLKNFNIVGADIMELAPDVDITKTSSATCCKLIREVLNLL